MNNNIAIVMDLGGTKIKLGLAENGNMLCTKEMDAYSQHGLSVRLPFIQHCIDEMLRQQGIDIHKVFGMGISIPGIVDSKKKKILSIDNKFNDAPQLDLSAWAKQNWNIPIQLENDARCALIGEWQYGKGKGCDNVVIMTIGTGVGSSAVIEGKVLRGKHFQAGCLGGHFTINIHGQRCNCGNYGCVEVEASTWNIARIAKVSKGFAESALAAEDAIDFESIFRCAANGDALAMQLREECINVWSACAVNLIHAYDPEILIVSGGVMRSADYIIPRLQQKVAEYAWTPWGEVKVEKAQNINTAALLGAAYLVYQS
ncbi:ROK family protein [Ilyomonas limi]|uniref:ROK family protein n=1 Tax=Ilyomonas limi TaxID=2575867 RepID=A0A4U3L916_9BACT|nr:ROK family protein [Ilyomonas limi]TKK71865.1 ROK family protein [Ilyomonas limi]